MVKAAAMMGMLDEEKAMIEMLWAFKRAGADMILTYFAKDAARVLHNN
jgi:porphobilinogen synthase